MSQPNAAAEAPAKSRAPSSPSKAELPRQGKRGRKSGSSSLDTRPRNKPSRPAVSPMPSSSRRGYTGRSSVLVTARAPSPTESSPGQEREHNDTAQRDREARHLNLLRRMQNQRDSRAARDLSESNLSNLLSLKNRQLQQTTTVCCILLSIVVCVIFLIAFPFWKSKTNEHSRTEGVCTTRECDYYTEFLRGTMELSAEPCDDFGTFMCGRWTHDHPVAVEVHKLAWDDALSETAKLLRSPSHRFRATKKASQMFESCLTLLSTGVESRPSVHSFRAFLRDRGVAWPDEPRDTTHPLDVLVDLSVNWLVDLFFALVVRRNGRTRLELKEAPVVWASFRGATHADQLQTVAELRHYASKMGSGLQLNKTRAQHLATVEARVLHFLETNLSVSNHARSLDVVDVAGLAEWTPAVPSSLWIAILKKHLKGAVVIRGSTEVLVDSIEHVVSFGNLLKQFSAKELLDLIGWWLARLFSDLAGIQRDSSKHSEARDAIVCARTVQPCYSLALTSEVASFNWSTERRKEVGDMFNAVIQKAIQLVKRCSWMDVPSKDRIANKMAGIRVTLWPDDVDDVLLDRAYASFPKQESLYIDYWLKARVAARSLLGTDIGELLYRHTRAQWGPLVQYDYWSNSVSVSLQALQKPLYPPDATQSLDYAGLGAAFANAVVQAFDARGITLTSAQDRRPLVDDSTFTTLVKRLECGNPAAELTAGAYFHGAWSTTSDPSGLKVHAARTADQVFFMAYCRLQCGDQDGAKFCSKGIRLLDSFVKSFGCQQRLTSDERAASCLFFS